MARKATLAEIYTATFIITTQDEADSFEDDGLRQDETAFHLRRVRSDATRSPAARHVAIERHHMRRAKSHGFTH